MFFGTPRLSSIRAGDQSLMRVFLVFVGQTFVAIVVSRLYMSSGGLAALLVKIVHPRRVPSLKACAHFFYGCTLVCGLRSSQQTRNVSKG